MRRVIRGHNLPLLDSTNHMDNSSVEFLLSRCITHQMDNLSRGIICFSINSATVVDFFVAQCRAKEGRNVGGHVAVSICPDPLGTNTNNRS